MGNSKDIKKCRSKCLDELKSRESLKGAAEIELDPGIYAALARELIENIGQGSFFNGIVDLPLENGHGSFTATLLVYRDNSLLPEGVLREICDIVPIWWEFRTWDEQAQEMLNNFDFATLREAIPSV